MESSMRKYLAEFIGTFTLVFIGTAVAVLQGMAGRETGFLEISFAFGGTLLVLVLVIGPISGCHINPAVSIAMRLSGRLDQKDLVPYLLCQFAGGAAASAILLMLLNGHPGFELATDGLGANGNPENMSIPALLLWEIILTALFLYTIFRATDDDFAPGATALAIGGFLFVAHLVGAQLGDSSLNPARSFGPALFAPGAWSVLWVYLLGPIIGGVLGWQLYSLLNE